MNERRTLPDTPGLLDARILLVAAVLVLPAAWQAHHGMLTVDQVLLRYLFLALGCTAAVAVARALRSAFGAAPTKPDPAAGSQDGTSTERDAG